MRSQSWSSFHPYFNILQSEKGFNNAQIDSNSPWVIFDNIPTFAVIALETEKQQHLKCKLFKLNQKGECVVVAS